MTVIFFYRSSFLIGVRATQRIGVIGFLALVAVACSDDRNRIEDSKQPVLAREEAQRSTATESNRPPVRSTLRLGARSYELGVVLCFGTSMATVTASDSHQRDDYPVVSAKIYDPARSGGHSMNTFSALFENSEPAEHWILHEGTVEKGGDTIAASGTLKGSLLLPNDDGTRRSVPM